MNDKEFRVNVVVQFADLPAFMRLLDAELTGQDGCTGVMLGKDGSTVKVHMVDADWQPVACTYCGLVAPDNVPCEEPAGSNEPGELAGHWKCRDQDACLSRQ